MIPRIFDGKTVAIVAGGPSLIGFDFSRLAGVNVIAINRAHENLRRADVLWWSDPPFFRRHREALLAHRAPWKATAQVGYEPGELPESVHVYRFKGMKGFDPRHDHLRHGNNSAYAAMHLAAHLGASRQVLFGVDMRYGSGGESHYHGGHFDAGRRVYHEEGDLRDKMLPYFGSLAGPLAERGIGVLNASPESALTVWPRCSLDAGVAACTEHRQWSGFHGNA